VKRVWSNTQWRTFREHQDFLSRSLKNKQRALRRQVWQDAERRLHRRISENSVVRVQLHFLVFLENFFLPSVNEVLGMSGVVYYHRLALTLQGSLSMSADGSCKEQLAISCVLMEAGGRVLSEARRGFCRSKTCPFPYEVVTGASYVSRPI
jgi:hypothetical protein